jgi:hypothetical protein
MLRDCDGLPREPTRNSLGGPDRLTPEEAVRTVEGRYGGDSCDSCGELSVNISVNQMRVDDAWPEATDLNPQSASKARIDMRSGRGAYDLHISLEQLLDEAVALLSRRRPHPHFDAGITKARKEGEQVSFAAPDSLHFLHVEDPHTCYDRYAVRACRLRARAGTC